jgi:DNA-binding CsgD family transcriptional regulator
MTAARSGGEPRRGGLRGSEGGEAAPTRLDADVWNRGRVSRPGADRNTRVRQALAFITLCDSSNDPAPVVEAFLTTIKAFGFHAAACGAWAGVGKNRRHRFFFLDWPPQWGEFYQNNNFFEDDFMVVEARRRIIPYLWSEIITQTKPTVRQRELDDAARAFGWREALAVPVHGPNSLQGLVTLATFDEINLSADVRALLQVMSIAVHERCRTSTSFGTSNPAPVTLSKRELECLQWVATGKTDWETAQLLGIKPVTAHYHVERIKQKYGVKSRVEAVAAAVLSGLV